MVFCGLVSRRRRRLRRPPRGAREAAAQRRERHLRARDVRRARLRLPVRLPRPAAHGDRPRATRARVRPEPDRDRAVGRVPRAHDRRRDGRGRQPERDAAAHEIDLDRGADPAGHHPDAVDVHRHAHGPLPDPSRRDGEARVPVAGAGRARLPHPAGRGRRRLLRSAEEPHAGLRQPRLRAGRLRAGEPGEGRRAPQRGPRRRVQHDRAPRQGLRVRPADVREAARAHPSADVRRADPGRDRRDASSPARR